MKVLESLYLKNVATFKKASLPLNEIGITQIRGHNKDSKNNLDKIDVNAVGKSLLLRPISEIIFSSSPQTQNIKSRTKGDMFTHADSEFGIGISNEKDTYSFSKHVNKKSYDYKVIKNGKNSKVRTKGYAENKIRSIFDYSEDEFYSIVFLDSRRTSILQLGSATQRIEFFTNLFRLNNYDDVRKIFNSIINESRKSATILKEVNSQVSELKTETKDLDLKSLKEKYKTLSESNKSLVKDYDKLNNKKLELLTAKSNADNYTSYKKLVKKLELPKAVDKQIEFLKASIKEYDQKKKLAKKWDYYNTAIEKFETRLTKYVKEFKSYELGSFKLSKISDTYKEIKKEVLSLRATLFNARDTVNKTTGMVKPEFDLDKFKKLKVQKIRHPKDVNKDISNLESKIETYDDTIGVLKDIHGDNCPTCKQTINKKQTQSLIDKYFFRVKTLVKNLKDLQNELKVATSFEEMYQEFDGYTFATKLYNESIKALDKANVYIKKYQPKLDKYETALDLLSKIKELDEPEKPTEKLKGKIDERTYANQLKCLTLYNSFSSVYETLETIDFDTLDSKIEKLSKSLKNLSSKLESESVKLSKITSKIDSLESNLNKLKTLKERQKTLSVTVEDIPIIEAIIEAYSNKGIKLLVIKHIASMIEKNMNIYAPLLYSEPTKFKFEVKDDRNVNIYICRTVNGKESEADIRTLSGAEGRAFSFLIPLSILPLIPHERRLNIMVLDEPMQNMSDARKNLFVESFVPKLNSIVPHLIIISTDNESYPNANVYTVVKENGVAELVKN